MRENEFEKRVQRQMEEFRLRPSGAVWEKVEEELRKKKKRRIVFFIFWLAGLSLLSYTGYFLFNNHSKKSISDQTFTQQPDNNPSSKNNSLATPANPSSHSNENGSPDQKPLTIKPKPKFGETQKENKDVKDSPANGVTDKNSLQNEARKQSVTPAPIEEMPAKTYGKISKEKKVKTNKQSQYEIPDDEVVRVKEIPAERSNVIDKKKNEETEEQPAITKTDVTNDKLLPAESQITGSLKNDSLLVKATKNDTARPIAKKQRQKPGQKIRWAFDGSAGVSKMRDNDFLFSNAQKSMMDQMYATPGNAGGNFGIPPVLPSEVKPGLAFKIGVAAQKDLTKKKQCVSGFAIRIYKQSYPGRVILGHIADGE